MKKGDEKYATKKRYIKKGYFRKHSNGSPCGKTKQTSCSNSLLEGWKIKEEEIEEINEKTSKPKKEEVEWFMIKQLYLD